MSADISVLERRIGYTFKNKELLKQALTHKSVGKGQSYERFEFFGDAILQIVISRHLFEKFEKVDEGVLSRQRSSLVREETLAEIAMTFDLGEFLIMDKGEMKSGGRHRASILADVVEAIICACYLDLDHDLDAVDAIMMPWFGTRLDELVSGETLKDPKSRLQEYLQARRLSLPEYELHDVQGEDHNQIFTVTCRVAIFDELFTGTGTSRRRAEQNAASKIIAKIGMKQ